MLKKAIFADNKENEESAGIVNIDKVAHINYSCARKDENRKMTEENKFIYEHFYISNAQIDILTECLEGIRSSDSKLNLVAKELLASSIDVYKLQPIQEYIDNYTRHQKWIRVEDRLPEHGKIVRVVFEGHRWEYHAKLDNGIWMYIDVMPQTPVTHWQEIELPDEKN